ncbi:MAG: CBS domain-containing protein [Proteobacteria bacterium]|nr:MAG: CBS domain-containing protein [Pseudomonadota bacterium]
MQNENAAANMTRSMVTVSYDKSIEEAYAMMQQWGVRHLPVRDARGKIVGILADSDIYRAMSPRTPPFEPSQTVGDYMSWPAITIDEATPIADVAEAMIVEKVSAFLVTKGGAEPSGIVTNEDLLRVLQRALDEHKPMGIQETVDMPSNAVTALPYSPVVREAMRELQSLGI